MSADPDVPWELVAKIRRSDRKSQIVLELDSSPASATELAEIMDIQRRSVSNYLHELKGMQPPVVECITPDQPHHRLYALTEDGAKIVGHIER